MRGFLLCCLLTATAAAQGDSRPAPEADTRPASRPVDRAVRIADAIRSEVETVRGLAADGPVKIGVYSVAELRGFVERAFARDLPPARIATMSRCLKALDLLPADYDLGGGLLALLTEQIAGFYDPMTGELRLIDRDPAELMGEAGAPSAKALAAKGVGLDEITMAHELVHALQDRHFGLRGLPLDVVDDDDLVTATQSLVEGDATVAMMAWSFFKSGVPAAQVFNPTVGRAAVGALDMDALPGGKGLKDAPPWLRESLVFPYVGGLTFCLKIASAARSFAPIDRAFRNPPLSTEHILHPEKYFGPEADPPQALALPALAATLGAGYAEESTNVLGELGFRTWFDAAPKGASAAERRAIKRAAAAAAAGWDGDRFALYGKPGAPDVLVLASVWDSPEDAEDAATAVAGRFPPAEPDAPPRIRVRAEGRDVYAVVGADAATFDRVVEILRRDLLRTEKSAPQKKVSPK